MFLYIGLLSTYFPPIFWASVVYHGKCRRNFLSSRTVSAHLVPLAKTGPGSQTVGHRMMPPHHAASLAYPGYAQELAKIPRLAQE